MNPGDINAFAEALDLLTKKAGVAVSTYGPTAFAIAQHYEHVTSLIVFFRSIGYIILFLIGAFCSYKYAAFTWNKYQMEKKERAVQEPTAFIFSVIAMIACLALSLTVLCSGLLSTETLLGVFSPKLAVIRSAMDIATGY